MAITKDFSKILPKDLVEHPIWIPSDNLENEDELAACEDGALISHEGDYLVGARFTLVDNSHYAGFIRVAEGKVTLLGFAISESHFAFLLLVDVFREMLGESYESFAEQLGRKSTEVFPVHYHTQFKFTDGASIQGHVNYKAGASWP